MSDGQKFAQFVQIKKQIVDLFQNNLQRKDVLLWMIITCWNAYKNIEHNSWCLTDVYRLRIFYIKLDF